MAKPRPPKTLDPAVFGIKLRKSRPFEFVLDALAAAPFATRPMFGCLAVYVQEKIVLALCDKPESAASNGVWLATTKEHHPSLRIDFPSMRSIPVLGAGVTAWQMLPADAAGFEEAALRACELILARDPRIGKTPKARRRGAKAAKRSA